MSDEIELPEDDGAVVVRSLDKREIDVRLVPFDTTISTRQGREEFAPGSTAHIPNDGLLLMGSEHAASIGLGQDGQPTITRHPAGRSTRVWEDGTGAKATFRVARTAAGDDILALADDGVVRGVSVEMDPRRNVVDRVKRGGQSVNRITKAALTGASLTYRPAYGEQATVLDMRSQEEDSPVGTEIEPVAPTGLSTADIEGLITRTAAAFGKPLEAITERLQQLEEQNRSQIVIPGGGEPEKQALTSGEWAGTVLRVMTGERVPDHAMRALDDVITTDNIGVVPPAYLTELIGVIDPSRPFLSSTRRLTTPSSGTKLIVPVINQRPEAGKQASEKAEVASQKTLIGTTEFDMETVAGAGDLSIQLIKRSSPEFLSLWIELLAEQYARETESLAIKALADSIGGFGNASPMNPANLLLGDAWVASFDAIRRGPDTIWLSTQAVGEFIDAKATTTNQPMYSNINLNATAAGGVSGSISGLRAVHVPMLDAHGAYALVGPVVRLRVGRGRDVHAPGRQRGQGWPRRRPRRA